MRQALICFENDERAKTTVVCAGNMILTKNRENINQTKLKLLDRIEKAYGPGTVSNSQQKLLLNARTGIDGEQRPQIFMEDVEFEESKA